MTHSLSSLEAALQVAWTRRDPTPAEVELQHLPERIPMAVHLVQAGRGLLLWLHDGGARKLAESQNLTRLAWRTRHIVLAHHEYLIQRLHRLKQADLKGPTLMEWLVGSAPVTESQGIPEPWHLLATQPEAVEGWARWVPRIEAVAPVVEWEADARGGRWPVVQSLRLQPAPYYGLRGIGPSDRGGALWVFPEVDDQTTEEEEA